MHINSEDSIIIPESLPESESESEFFIHPSSNQPNNNNNNNNNMGLLEEDSQLFSQPQTQTQTEQSQPQTQLSQLNSNQWSSNLWGILMSLSDNSTTTTNTNASTSTTTEEFIPRPNRIDLEWVQKEYKIGRHPTNSDIVLKGKKVSSNHCLIKVELSVDGIGVIKLTDLSTNGTFVRGRKVGKNNTTILQSGDEIIFGPPTTVFSHDFRYTFLGPPTPINSNGNLYSSTGGGIFKLYELREELGRGSFASVRKAVQRKTGNLVAVKIINKNKFIGDPQTMAMFRREIEIMKELDHSYCVKFVDFFEDDQKLWLVLEYSDGGDLLEYIMSRQGLKESETRQIALMICQAVNYLHSKGIAHRDIKPENILMSKGARPLCKVADFGLAKMVDAGTKWRTMCGTPTYLAPEIIKATKPEEGYSNAVDAWSIGIVLYSCLTNSTPFDESESTPLQERIQARKVDFSHVRSNGVSEIAIDFLNKLLNNDPSKRMTVHDSLNHPWLATKDQDGNSTSTLPLLVSTLPFNSRSQPTEGSKVDTELLTATGLSASGEGSSFVYSQQLGDLRLNTNGRSSLASSLYSNTTSDRTALEEESEMALTELGDISNEATLQQVQNTARDNTITSSTKQQKQRKELKVFESIISPLGKRKVRDEDGSGEEEEQRTLLSAFSSASSVGTPKRKTRVLNSSTSNSTLGGIDTGVRGLGIPIQEREVEFSGSDISGSDIADDAAEEDRMAIEGIISSFMEVENELEPLSTRTSRARGKGKGKVAAASVGRKVRGTGMTSTLGRQKKAVVAVTEEMEEFKVPELPKSEGIMTRWRAKASKLS